jgi:predicted chitinase
MEQEKQNKTVFRTTNTNVEKNVSTELPIESYKVLDAYFAYRTDKVIPPDAKKKETETKYEYTFEKIDRGIISRKLYVIVKTEAIKEKNIKISICSAKEKVLTDIDTSVKLLYDSDELNEKELQVNNYYDDGTIKNKNSFKNQTIFEVTLQPKNDSDVKTWKDTIYNSTNKKASLYIKVEVADDSAITYNGKGIRNKCFLYEQPFELYTCYCNREIGTSEMIALIYYLRDKQNYKKERNSFFNNGSEYISAIRINNGKLTENQSKLKLFTDEMNAMFKKFGINTCKRKIHFIGQMYLETISFRYTYENRTTVPSNYFGGVDFQGRGMKQITHDYNYLAYYDYINSTNLEKNVYEKHCKRNSQGGADESVGEFIENNKNAKGTSLTTEFYSDLKTFAKNISEDLFHAFNSAGWFSTIYKSSTLQKMDEGLNDSHVKAVTKAINGGINNLTERQNYTKWTKDFFNYDTNCINK